MAAGGRVSVSGHHIVLPVGHHTRIRKTGKAQTMKPAAIIGIILIVLGALALLTKGFSFTQRETHDLGPIEITTTDKKHVPIAPILGGLAIAGGVALLFVGNRRRA